MTAVPLIPLQRICKDILPPITRPRQFINCMRCAVQRLLGRHEKETQKNFWKNLCAEPPETVSALNWKLFPFYVGKWAFLVNWENHR